MLVVNNAPKPVQVEHDRIEQVLLTQFRDTSHHQAPVDLLVPLT